MGTHCIITRYNEYIDWIKYIHDKVDTIYVYNKGTNENYFKNESVYTNVIFIKMENVGRIDHTLVYHILTHWDNLPDVLVSLPASILMCYKKGAYLSSIVKRVDITKTKYNGFFSPRFHKVNDRFNYTREDFQPEGVCNKNNNPFIKSEYPDFKAWKSALIDDRPMRYVGMRGMFSVCKENIKHIKKEIYENLLASLSVGDNIENGHFAERIWAHLFRQYSFDSIKN